MAKVREKLHAQKLKRHHINILTTFHSNGKTLTKNSDGSKNDNVSNGVILNKMYYQNGKIIHVSSDFDSRITYRYINNQIDNKEVKCPNCGYLGKIEAGENGCPFCGTDYNLDYDDSKVNLKHAYDTIIKSTKYRTTFFLIDLAICVLLMYFYISGTSRSFNQFDLIKIFGYGGVLASVIYFIFYRLDAKVVLAPLKRKKEAENFRQRDFWKRMQGINVNKSTFFNNLNFELNRYYFSDKTDVIDFNILDYSNFEYDDKNQTVSLMVDITLLSLNNGKISEKNQQLNFKLKRNNIKLTPIEGGLNLITCRNCGSSINVESNQCEHCGTFCNYLQEWYLV